MSLHPHDPAYSEKSAYSQLCELFKSDDPRSAGAPLILLADLVDVLRGIVEHQDERIIELERRIDALAAVQKLMDAAPRQAEGGADIAE